MPLARYHIRQRRIFRCANGTISQRRKPLYHCGEAAIPSSNALRFKSRNLGGFTEVIEPSALDGVIEKSDILCLLNHNEDKGVLARSKFGKGSLSLSVDDTGLKYRFEAPNTALGNELLEGLRRGDITTSSFAFTIDSDKWEKRDNGTYLRRITQFKELFDVSPVYKEAYPDTTVACRKMQELDNEDLKE